MMLEAVNLNKFFGARQALDSVSFAIGKGEAAGVLGTVASGKSTLMRILSGFLEPTHGQVRVAGMDPRHPRTRDRIGYLPEDNPLPARMRVREYLRYRARLRGLYGPAGTAALGQAVERCGLGGLGEMLIAHLPGETQHRIGLAECLLSSPDVLLLDQPFARLDPQRTAETRELLSRLDGVTVLVASNRLNELERFCKRLLVLHRGRVVTNDTVENIYDRNVDERVVNLELISREPVRETLRAITGVRTVAVEPSPDSPDTVLVRLTIPAGVDLRHELSQVCSHRGWLVTGMRLEPVKVQDILRKMAQRR